MPAAWARSNRLPAEAAATLRRNDRLNIVLVYPLESEHAFPRSVAIFSTLLPGHGKNAVLIAGDDEYHSEQMIPQFAKILEQRQGFHCTVLYSTNEKGEIDPHFRGNIPGLDALKKADLLILFTRFRDLPDDQMKFFVDYVESGKPIFGIRTATHAFEIPKGKTYSELFVE